MEYKNVTLRLPEPLLRKFRIYAATRNESMTSLVADLIEEAVADDPEKEHRKRHLLKSLRHARSHGTGGVFTWTRDEVHERR